jgi:hypothetical protein
MIFKNEGIKTEGLLIAKYDLFSKQNIEIILVFEVSLNKMVSIKKRQTI